MRTNEEQNRVTTIIARPGQAYGQSITVTDKRTTNPQTSSHPRSWNVATRERNRRERSLHGTGKGGAEKVFAEQIREAGNQVSSDTGGARVPLFVRLNKILLRAACTRDETRAEISYSRRGCLVSLLETNKRPDRVTMLTSLVNFTQNLSVSLTVELHIVK